MGHYDKLVKLPRVDIENIATKAYSRGLISNGTLVSTQSRSFAPMELLTAVSCQIQLDRQSFYTFVEILKEEPAHAIIAERLEDAMKRFSSSTTDMTHSPPHYKVPPHFRERFSQQYDSPQFNSPPASPEQCCSYSPIRSPTWHPKEVMYQKPTSPYLSTSYEAYDHRRNAVRHESERHHKKPCRDVHQDYKKRI